MIWKVLKISLLFLAVAVVAGFLAGNLGSVRVEWLGYAVTANVFVAAAVFWAAGCVVFALVRLLAAIFKFGRKREG
jgi:uncharacterized protein HemY